MNPAVDSYIEQSDLWPDEMTAVRPLLLAAGLVEEIKWRKPCYSHAGKNIAILQEMKDFLSLMFFKGALLSDPDGVLEDQGPNSRSARRIVFRSVDDVERMTDAVRALLDQAIDVEESGRQVESSPQLELVEELQQRLDADPAFERAFRSLTPGRQREYNLFFSGAKQSTTRRTRIDRYAEKILAGRGLRDR